jgi:hypothetical protein
VINPADIHDDDDPPTLQRFSPSTNLVAAAPLVDAFPDEATTANDLDVLGSADLEQTVGPVAAHELIDGDTEKMPIEVRAGLLRQSQVDDGV